MLAAVSLSPSQTPAALLHGTREGAIVDQLAPYAFDAANAFEGRAADQNAAAGGARGAAP